MGDGLADERVGNCHGAEILGYDVGQVKEPTTRNRHEPIESRHRRSAEHYSALEQIQRRDGQVTDSMIVIPGHGAVGDKPQLAFYRDLLVGTREKVAALKKQDKSLDEIVASKPTAATDAKWGNGFRSPKDFIGDVFQGV